MPPKVETATKKEIKTKDSEEGSSHDHDQEKKKKHEHHHHDHAAGHGHDEHHGHGGYGHVHEDEKAKYEPPLERGGWCWNDIKLVVLDPGGQPIYDAEGNVIDKTKPIHELKLTEKRKVMISRTIQETMDRYFFTMEYVIKIWSCFINMDATGDGYVTLPNLFKHVEENTYSVLAPIIERFFLLIEKEEEHGCGDDNDMDH